MGKRDELEEIARSAMSMDLNNWVQLVNNTITKFKNDVKPHTITTTLPLPLVSYNKDTTYGLTQLHLLSLFCPVERAEHFKQLMIYHDIDKGVMAGIFRQMVASIASQDRRVLMQKKSLTSYL